MNFVADLATEADAETRFLPGGRWFGKNIDDLKREKLIVRCPEFFQFLRCTVTQDRYTGRALQRAYNSSRNSLATLARQAAQEARKTTPTIQEAA